MTCSSLCILGVDPGVSGAIAFYFPSAADVSLPKTCPMPATRLIP